MAAVVDGRFILQIDQRERGNGGTVEVEEGDSQSKLQEVGDQSGELEGGNSWWWHEEKGVEERG